MPKFKFLLCVIILGVIGTILAYSFTDGFEPKMNVSFMIDEEIIHLWEGNDGYYLFLPSYADYIGDNKKGKLLENNPQDISGGYLLEREYLDRHTKENNSIVSSFTTKTGENFIVQSPKYCSKEEIEYISNFVQEAEDAVLSKDGINEISRVMYTEYINLDSFENIYWKR